MNQHAPGEGELSARLRSIRERIEAARARSSRAAPAVRLVAASKTQPPQQLAALLAAGQIVFGENYVQEAESKAHLLARDPQLPRAQFHLIGSLQRNKAKRAIGLFDVIETVDRISLAGELQKAASKRRIVQRVLVQVNTSGEESKSGVRPEEAAELCREILSCPALELQGLMCIGAFAPLDAPDEERRRDFVLLRELRADLEQRLGAPLPELSMGMSADFELAVEEGASLVRVGSALFGPRQQKGETEQ